jgi:hypothetical protein
MSALISHAQLAAGNVGSQLQRTAGSVGNQLQTTTNRLLPPRQREQKIKELRAFANRNPKLAVCLTYTPPIHRTNVVLDLSRLADRSSRHTTLSLHQLRPVNPIHLSGNRSPLRHHHCLHLHILCRWRRSSLLDPHALPS